MICLILDIWIGGFRCNIVIFYAKMMCMQKKQVKVCFSALIRVNAAELLKEKHPISYVTTLKLKNCNGLYIISSGFFEAVIKYLLKMFPCKGMIYATPRFYY